MSGNDALSAAQKRAQLQKLLQEKEGRLRQPPLRPYPAQRDEPLSFTQQGLWFLHQLEPESPAYNEVGVIRFEGALRVELWEAALSEIFARHSALRTTFAADELGAPVARVAEPAPLALPRADLSGLEATVQSQQVLARVSAEANRPFRLDQGPLVRFELLRLGPTEHLLITNAHHIITDGWSFGLLLRELIQFHDALSAGLPLPALPRPLQYSDFAHWQRDTLAGALLSRQLDYWKKQLYAVPALELPTDRPRSPTRSSQGSVFRAALISPELAAGLRRLAQEEGVTVFVLLCAAVQAFLGRLAQQSDVAVGASFAGRPRGSDSVFGLFTNTVVLRAQFEDDPTFRAFIARAQRVQLAALEHQDVPFEKVVEAVNPDRDLSRTPLFQVLFDVQKPAEAQLSGGVRLTPEHVLNRTSKFDLSIAFIEQAAAFELMVVYSDQLFEEASVQRLAQRLTGLLEAIVQDPSQRISALPLIPEAERRELLELHAGAERALPDATLHQLVEQQAALTPEALALLHSGTSLSYRELDERANQLAHLLLARGVGPQTLVAVCLERGVNAVVALLAVMKAGGAYVPVDPTLPFERVQLILDDALAPVVLTDSGLSDLVSGGPAFVVAIDALSAMLSSLPSTHPPSGARPGDLAYVIYTSGSTGKPKGVLVEHRGAANTVRETARSCDLAPGSRVLQFASPGFDVSILEALSALCSGAALVLADRQALLPGADLRTVIRENEVDTLILTPPVLATLDPDALPGVRTIITGGEASSADLMDRWAKGRRFINQYGPTEASITTTAAHCLPGSGKPPIGKPLRGARVYVLDQNLALVPLGSVGELYVGGVGVARGYLGRPELTFERFIPDPFGAPGARLYRTGDLVRFRSDGALEFVGRADQQIKLRGFRIELGEIDSALSALPSVKHAVAHVLSDASDNKQLVAYLVPEPGARLTEGELRAGLQRSLPHYMVPSAFVVLDQLPMTPNGKVDRAALRRPEERAEQKQAEGALTPVEAQLLGIWRELLGLQNISLKDNFFEIGGHSLLAAQVASRIAERFQLELPVRVLFEQTTLRGLGAYVSAALGGGGLLDVSGPVPMERESAALVVSLAQEQLLRLEQQMPGTATHTVVDAYRIDGALDDEVLARAWAEVLRRHDVLRTAARGGAGALELLAAEAVPFGVRDLRALSSAERQLEVDREIDEAGRRTFALDGSPLSAARVLKLSDAEQVLLLCMHQLVTDSTTMDTVLAELLALHQSAVSSAAYPLEPVSLQYQDFAAWQRQHSAAGLLDQQTALWGSVLASVQPTRLRGAKVPPALPAAWTKFTARRSLPAAAEQALRALGKASGATTFVVLAAALAALVRGLSDGDLVIATPALGRGRPELERMPGFFINYSVLRMTTAKDASFLSLLSQTKQAALFALSHQELPFELIVEKLGLERGAPLRMPLHPVLLSLHQGEPLTGELHGHRVSRLKGKSGTARCDLSLRAWESTSGLSFEFEFDPDVFSADDGAALLEAFGLLLARAVESPETLLAQLPVAELIPK